MAHSSKETLAVGWCDNGDTDGKFTEGLVYTLIHSAVHGIPFHNGMRVQGNQIARQRQALLDTWYDSIKTDWLLWVDSDIVLTMDVLKLLWNTADKVSRPVVSGVYFISKQMESPLMQPMPVLFNEINEEYRLDYLHPLPPNQVVKVDCAGFGLILMHRSAITRMKEKFGNDFFFAENNDHGDKFIGEDIAFFRKMKQAGVPLHAHTGALVQHMKRFSFDVNYYNLFWMAAEAVEKKKEQNEKA